nr:hypothetical protein [Lachnospiraceae bacterium]
MDNNKTIENRRKFIINFLYYAIILGCVIIFMRYLIYFIMPFFIAFVISLILRPLVRWSTKKLKISRNIASAFWVILFFMTVGFLTVLLCINLFSFTQNLILKIPSYFT